MPPKAFRVLVPQVPQLVVQNVFYPRPLRIPYLVSGDDRHVSDTNKVCGERIEDVVDTGLYELLACIR
jgi:hypothetical protein